MAARAECEPPALALALLYFDEGRAVAEPFCVASPWYCGRTFSFFPPLPLELGFLEEGGLGILLDGGWGCIGAFTPAAHGVGMVSGCGRGAASSPRADIHLPAWRSARAECDGGRSGPGAVPP